MKSQCRSIQQHLSDYIDRGLSKRQNVKVKNHLRRCSACRYEFESLRRTTGLLNYYVEPEPPKGYHDRFWRELQFTIEQTDSQPVWKAGIGLWQGVRNTGQSLADRLAYSCRSLVDAPSQWLLKWGRLAPVYGAIFVVMSGIFVATRFTQPPEENRGTRASQLRNPLAAAPIQLTRARENRELITKRERAPGLPQGLASQERRTPQKVNHQLEISELSKQGWGSYDRAPFDGNSETPRGHTEDSDVFPDFIASAQLTAPGTVLTTREFSVAVAIDSPFPEKFEREGRRSNSSLRVLKDVAVHDLSLTAVYDSVKL